MIYQISSIYAGLIGSIFLKQRLAEGLKQE